MERCSLTSNATHSSGSGSFAVLARAERTGAGGMSGGRWPGRGARGTGRPSKQHHLSPYTVLSAVDSTVFGLRHVGLRITRSLAPAQDHTPLRACAHVRPARGGEAEGIDLPACVRQASRAERCTLATQCTACGDGGVSRHSGAGAHTRYRQQHWPLLHGALCVHWVVSAPRRHFGSEFCRTLGGGDWECGDYRRGECTTCGA